MTTVKFIGIAAVAIGLPLLIGISWAWAAKGQQAAQEELTRYPSVRRYAIASLILVFLFLLALLPSVVWEIGNDRSLPAVARWICLAVQAAAVVGMLLVEKLKRREIRRYRE